MSAGVIYDDPGSRRWAGANHLPDRYRGNSGAPILEGAAAETLHSAIWAQDRPGDPVRILTGAGNVTGTCWHVARFVFRGMLYRVAGPYRPDIMGFRAELLAGPDVDPADWTRAVLDAAHTIDR